MQSFCQLCVLLVFGDLEICDSGLYYFKFDSILNSTSTPACPLHSYMGDFSCPINNRQLNHAGLLPYYRFSKTSCNISRVKLLVFQTVMQLDVYMFGELHIQPCQYYCTKVVPVHSLP